MVATFQVQFNMMVRLFNLQFFSRLFCFISLKDILKMLVNNLLELLTSKEKQLSVLSQIPSNNKKIGVTQKVEKNSLFFAESGVKSSIYYKQLVSS